MAALLYGSEHKGHRATFLDCLFSHGVGVGSGGGGGRGDSGVGSDSDHSQNTRIYNVVASLHNILQKDV